MTALSRAGVHAQIVYPLDYDAIVMYLVGDRAQANTKRSRSRREAMARRVE